MTDDDCARPWKERFLDWRIRVWARLKARAAKLLRPGAWLTSIAVAVYGASTLAKSLDWPKDDYWMGGSVWIWILVISGIGALLGYCLVTLGYAHHLKQRERDNELAAACRSIARIIDNTTSIPYTDIGVHVWTVSGGRVAPYLARRVRFLPDERRESAVTWRKGRGVIGLCWEEDAAKVVNLAALEALAPTKDLFCQLEPGVRLNLSWHDFQETKKYRCVCALPLRAGPEGARAFRGCLSIDVRADGKVAELRQVLRTHEEKLGRVLTLCDAALER